jgi:hypothetical protein
MQHVDPALPFTLLWNSFTPDPASTVAYTFIDVQDDDTGATPFQANYLTPDTSTTNIAANTLLYGKNYAVSIFFSDRQDFPNAGFGGALGTIGFDNVTHTTLATILPWLQITLADTNVVLTWPALATNFVLSSAAQLAPNPMWYTITNQPTVLGGTNSLVLPAWGSQQFFRLSTF